MIVVNDILTSNIEFEDTYVAIGNFDGVHYGHKKLINETIKAARENSKKAVVFTFEKHPLEFLFPERKFDYINTNEEKLYLLESLGVDVVIMQKLDKNFLEYTPLEFVRILKNKLKVKEIFVGFNFSFGKGGLGTAEDLEYLAEIHNIKVNELPPVTLDGELVSSSAIRKKIANSDFDGAIKLLDHPMIVIGEVIHGKKIARQLGFPTTNIKMDNNRLYPPSGIYGAFLQVSDKNSKVLYGVVNIGYNPTLKQEMSLEVHILDFDREVYGEKMYIQIVKFMRKEKKFSSIDELKATIQADVDRWKLFKREMKYGRTSSKS
ncbi:bifunctional riboflavin kinase/FAD synthetase [Fusobacterium pseudoperiodonticum]|uniref:Riboflavin biosynthesis protein n=1 Tax=Fusobacterium pseudoperiodonticum TaxID=2663009 RepID=A0AAD0F1D1_9FUSO|nr:bifunctional riboflavin kinase/FAD synthetase [Fusobacterium pseudoperiodonticum]ATV35570.1 bifunctional riboflavin kinase/FMN adenylyltransferase [Fusobacterium pseudoperiodonticum]ATV61536.1 bifunctional riboflavin kinase/FMN adenylyltransferase [Fusobacterium pseudoperiodonticum]